MIFFRAIFKRPVITLTIAYIITLIILDHAGFYSVAPRDDVSRYISGSYADVQAVVLDTPVQKNNRIRCTVRVSSVDGNKAGGKILVTLFPRDAAEPVEQGDKLAFTARLLSPPPARNPGVFDYASYLRRNGIYTLAYVAEYAKTGRIPLPFYRIVANAVRTDMLQTMHRYLPAAEAGVLIPMVIGEKSELSEDEKHAFQDSGLTHLLVVSGLNVGYVVIVFLGVFRLAGLRKRYAAVCTIPFILLFMLVAGDNPPVVRATVMAIFVILSLALAREPLIYQSLALAAAVNLIFDPQALFTASFQLSFAATIGIVYLYPFFMKPFENMPRWLRDTLGGTFAVSLAAQLAVLPVIAWYFNRVSVIGIISNIVVVPWAGIITALGIVVYLIHFVSHALTVPVGHVTAGLMHGMLFFVHLFARVPFSTVAVATPSPLFMVGYYALLAVIPHVAAIYRRIPKWLSAMAAICAGAGMLALFFTVFAPVRESFAIEPLYIRSLYVGNGTAVHITFPNNKHWFIDIGRERDGERVITPYLNSKGIRHIDGIIITSGDKHHYGGLGKIAGSYGVTKVLYPRKPSKDLARLLVNISDKNILLEKVRSNVTYFIEGSTVTLLSADRRGDTLAVLLDYAGRRIVFLNHGALPENPAWQNLMTGKTVDLLHLSCHRKETEIAGCIGRIKPAAILLSGTLPENMPETGKVYSPRENGSVSISVTVNGIGIETFTERHCPSGTH